MGTHWIQFLPEITHKEFTKRIAMAAGGPGDHPLSDVLNFNLDVYNKTCDELIRRISEFVPIHRLYEMFDWFDNFTGTKEQLLDFEKKLSQKLEELESDAESNGSEKRIYRI